MFLVKLMCRFFHWFIKRISLSLLFWFCVCVFFSFFSVGCYSMLCWFISEIVAANETGDHFYSQNDAYGCRCNWQPAAKKPRKCLNMHVLVQYNSIKRTICCRCLCFPFVCSPFGSRCSHLLADVFGENGSDKKRLSDIAFKQPNSIERSTSINFPVKIDRNILRPGHNIFIC